MPFSMFSHPWSQGLRPDEALRASLLALGFTPVEAQILEKNPDAVALVQHARSTAEEKAEALRLLLPSVE
jgi:hypothetical protein